MTAKIARIVASLLSAAAAAALFGGLSAWFMSRLDPAQQEIISLAYARRAANGSIADNAWADEVRGAQRASMIPANAEIVGIFSGEFADGAPVYRLPPIIVVAKHKSESIQAREEQLPRGRPAPIKDAGRPPV